MSVSLNLWGGGTLGGNFNQDTIGLDIGSLSGDPRIGTGSWGGDQGFGPGIPGRGANNGQFGGSRGGWYGQGGDPVYQAAFGYNPAPFGSSQNAQLSSILESRLQQEINNRPPGVDYQELFGLNNRLRQPPPDQAQGQLSTQEFANQYATQLPDDLLLKLYNVAAGRTADGVDPRRYAEAVGYSLEDRQRRLSSLPVELREQQETKNAYDDFLNRVSQGS